MFEELVGKPVGESMARALGESAKPVHARVDDAAKVVARRMAAPVHAKVDDVLDELASLAVRKLTDTLFEPTRRR